MNHIKSLIILSKNKLLEKQNIKILFALNICIILFNNIINKNLNNYINYIYILLLIIGIITEKQTIKFFIKNGTFEQWSSNKNIIKLLITHYVLSKIITIFILMLPSLIYIMQSNNLKLYITTFSHIILSQTLSFNIIISFIISKKIGIFFLILSISIIFIENTTQLILITFLAYIYTTLSKKTQLNIFKLSN